MTQSDWDAIGNIAFICFILVVLITLIARDWDDFGGGW